MIHGTTKITLMPVMAVACIGMTAFGCHILTRSFRRPSQELIETPPSMFAPNPVISPPFWRQLFDRQTPVDTPWSYEADRCSGENGGGRG